MLFDLTIHIRKNLKYKFSILDSLFSIRDSLFSILHSRFSFCNVLKTLSKRLALELDSERFSNAQKSGAPRSLRVASLFFTIITIFCCEMRGYYGILRANRWSRDSREHE